MKIEVAYAEREQQTVIELDLPSDATVADALQAAKAHLPDVDLDNVPLGIFGQTCERDKPLKEWDRVEIYRPLIMDAKEARRQRALKQKVKEQKAKEQKASEKK